MLTHLIRLGRLLSEPPGTWKSSWVCSLQSQLLLQDPEPISACHRGAGIFRVSQRSAFSSLCGTLAKSSLNWEWDCRRVFRQDRVHPTGNRTRQTPLSHSAAARTRREAELGAVTLTDGSRNSWGAKFRVSCFPGLKPTFHRIIWATRWHKGKDFMPKPITVVHYVRLLPDHNHWNLDRKFQFCLLSRN